MILCGFTTSESSCLLVEIGQVTCVLGSFVCLRNDGGH